MLIKRMARATIDRARLLFAAPIQIPAATELLAELLKEARLQREQLSLIAERLNNLEIKADSQSIARNDTTAVLSGLFPGQGELGWEDPRSASSLFREMCVMARSQSIEIIRTEMRDAMCILDHREFLLDAVEKSPSEGVILEFGVFSGKTLKWMAEAFPKRQFYGFDSFRGLPSAWHGYKKMNFDRAGNPPELPANVQLFVGRFDETLPNALRPDDMIAMIHVDCDLYESAKTIFDELQSKVRPRTVLVFDEYFNYPGFQHHEFRALREFLSNSQQQIEWLTYSGERAMGRISPMVDFNHDRLRQA